MKILVTGSNGLLGQKLVHKLKKDSTVQLIATARGANRLKDANGYKYLPLDITVEKEVAAICAAEKPDVIIHTAAMTNVDACEVDKEGAELLNVTAVQYLLTTCAKNNIHLVHLSTDFIFDGEDGPYDEHAEAKPLSFYGETKLDAEKLILESNVNAAILRTVLVFGVAEEMSRSNIVLWAKGALEAGKKLTVVDDQFRTPTLAEDLADGCILAAKQKATGIFNISGADFMSVLQLVQRVGKTYNLDVSLVEPISSNTLNQAAKRPPKTGFVLDKARRELGYNPHSFEDGLKIVATQLKNRA